MAGPQFDRKVQVSKPGRDALEDAPVEGVEGADEWVRVRDAAVEVAVHVVAGIQQQARRSDVADVGGDPQIHVVDVVDRLEEAAGTLHKPVVPVRHVQAQPIVVRPNRPRGRPKHSDP